MRRAPVLLAALLAVTGAAAGTAQAEPARAQQSLSLGREIARQVPKELRGFYAARGNRPLWLAPDGRAGPALAPLRALLDSAALDGLKPRAVRAADLRKAIAQADERPGDPQRLARLELAASRAYARYVEALRKAPRAAMIYETVALQPAIPTPEASLRAAAAAPSLAGWIKAMGWMNPLYAPLRAALGEPRYSEAERGRIALNLARVRAIPAISAGRWVLVDAASARLWMYEGARPVGSMKVVVGKPDTQTPVMAGFLRYALVNPYWNLPDDLMPSRVTDKVLEQGPGFVRANGFEVLSGWDADARVLDPRKVDWRAVKTGTQTVRARQLPGPDNFMGRVKFMFPNPQGIYLHDTPERELLSRADRQFSNGCVRLEDAARLGRWLLGKPLPRPGRKPEQRIELPVPVPIYLTYLTAQPAEAAIAFRSDVYGLDGAASGGGRRMAGAR